jgi:HSP20 family protein
MSTLTKWNPFRADELDWPFTSRWSSLRDLDRMQRDIDRLFGRVATGGDGRRQEAMAVTEWAPLVDITEDDKEYLIKAELPELKKEDVQVRVEKGNLILSGERRFEREEKEKKYHRIERAYGSFVRSFSLPEDADPSRVSAEFKDGLLRVHLPKSPSAKASTVDIKVS